MADSPTAMPVAPRLPRWAGDVAVLVLLLVSSAGATRGALLVRPWEWAVPLVACGAVLALRRRFPLPVAAACIAIATAAGLLGWPPGAPVVAVAVATYGVARRVGRAAGVAVAVAGALLLVLADVVATGDGPLQPRAISPVLLVVAASAIGEAGRSRAEYVAAVTERAVRAEQTRELEARRRVAEERLRIARDLHDVVAHQMTVINLQAGLGVKLVRSDPDRAIGAMTATGAAARSVLAEIGGLLAVLRSGDGAAEPLPGPVRGLAGIDPLIADLHATGLTIERRQRGEPVALSPAVDAVAYRVVQEALTNVRRHASEPAAALLLEWRPGSLGIRVENASAAAPPPGAAGGHGLGGMRERVESVHGTMRASAADGRFRVAVSLPAAGDAP